MSQAHALPSEPDLVNKISIKITLCTAIALIAFAGNSILCRLALRTNVIDAASFTSIRLLSGILMLWAILVASNRVREQASRGSWMAAIMLFVYAAAFSFAYISLDTGIGALILFGTVQITMILSSLIRGNRLHYSEWLGLLLAFTGFVYLMSPSINTPSISGAVLMTLAGVAWGLYTLAGSASRYPLNDSAYNFLRTLPFVLILTILTLQGTSLSSEGVLLAVLSGALASGLGYVIWYIAVAGLSTTQAAVVQLLVPVIAALGGVVFAQEVVDSRFVFSSALIIGGIFTVVMGRAYLLQK